jgi:hypothetical protein
VGAVEVPAVGQGPAVQAVRAFYARRERARAYSELLGMFLGEHDVVNRLIDKEADKAPSASRTEWIVAAIERARQDGR